jgi:hypothetical protein
MKHIPKLRLKTTGNLIGIGEKEHEIITPRHHTLTHVFQ